MAATREFNPAFLRYLFIVVFDIFFTFLIFARWNISLDDENGYLFAVFLSLFTCFSFKILVRPICVLAAEIVPLSTFFCRHTL